MPDPASFWDKRADKYAQQPIKDMASYRDTLERTRRQLSPGDEVLEVGCGTGTTALHLAPSARRITASDVSGRMIEIAKAKAVEQQLENVRFERATLFDEKLEAGSFDVVMAFNLLHLLEDIPGAVRRIHALLKPGGRFVSKTPCPGEQSRLWSALLTVLRLLGFAPYVRCLSFAELEGILTEAGFEILETHAYPKTPPSRFVLASRS